MLERQYNDTSFWKLTILPASRVIKSCSQTSVDVIPCLVSYIGGTEHQRGFLRDKFSSRLFSFARVVFCVFAFLRDKFSSRLFFFARVIFCVFAFLRDKSSSRLFSFARKTFLRFCEGKFSSRLCKKKILPSLS
jgi:hypothetical protein